MFRVDGRVQNYPSSSSQFTVGNNVNEDGLLVGGKTVNDLGALLQDFVVLYATSVI